MGTRNLTVVRLRGQYRVAQYGQWDGYPSGQGNTVLEFLKTWNRPVFEEKVLAASYMTKEDDADFEKEYGSGKDYKKFWEKYSWLSRDMGAKILKHIQDAPLGIKIQDQLYFAADSLFCEYAYVLDLDANVLEVYKGFNKSPLKEGDRFFSLPKHDHSSTKEYYPIRLAKSYPLDQLPTVGQMEIDVNGEPEE